MWYSILPVFQNMKKVLLIIAPLLSALLIFLGFQFFLSRTLGKGALQVTSTPKSNVYLNGKFSGQTPLCLCDAKNSPTVGEYTIRLASIDGSFSPFEEKIQIVKSVLTVVDRTFDKGAFSEANILTLNPLSNAKDIELLVLSFPQKATVLIDNNESGETPLLLKNLTESDHTLTLRKDGYREKDLRIRTVAGYKLTAVTYLGIDANSATVSPTLQPSLSNPSPSPIVSKITILETPTGFLRVREDASLYSAEITRVNPGESYPFVDEKEGWYAIRLVSEKTGWVSSQYAKKD